MSDIVQKIWGFCHTLRHDGVDYGDYIEQLTYLLFLKMSEQQEIVRRVEGLFALADQLEMRLAKARGQVDKLTPSLLGHAFAGKLVPQDPTDEPAEKLLQRINRKEKPGYGNELVT